MNFYQKLSALAFALLLAACGGSPSALPQPADNADITQAAADAAAAAADADADAADQTDTAEASTTQDQDQDQD